MVCSRCNVEMTLEPLFEGSERMAWFCPCCKARMRTVEMMQADAERQAAEMALTMVEYDAHCDSLIDRAPLDEETLTRIRERFEILERDHVPPCEHVSNPWRKSP